VDARAWRVVAVTRTAVLLIRMWLEEDLEETEVRARLTESRDITSHERTEKTIAGENEILAAVAETLRSFAEGR
jgi:hypothetical protein